jgi:hypothetical protein
MPNDNLEPAEPASQPAGSLSAEQTYCTARPITRTFLSALADSLNAILIAAPVLKPIFTRKS